MSLDIRDQGDESGVRTPCRERRRALHLKRYHVIGPVLCVTGHSVAAGCRIESEVSVDPSHRTVSCHNLHPDAVQRLSGELGTVG